MYKKLLSIFFISFIATLNVIADPTDQEFENFDGVATPLLPGAWSSTSTNPANKWITVNTASFSTPNSAFAPNPGSENDSFLTSEVYSFGTASAPYSLALNFYHKFEMEEQSPTLAWDGGVVEVSFNGGAFRNVLSPLVGGVFTQGDYNRTISRSRTLADPFNGRRCFSGVQSTFQNSRLVISNIPTSVTSVQFRWFVTTDNVVSKPGWWIDYFRLEPLIDIQTTTSQIEGRKTLSPSTFSNTVGITNASPFPIESAQIFASSYGVDIGNFDFSRGTLTKFSPRFNILMLQKGTDTSALLQPGESLSIPFNLNNTLQNRGAAVGLVAQGTPLEARVPFEFTGIGQIPDDETVFAQAYVVPADPCVPIAPAPNTIGKFAFFGQPVLPCTLANAMSNLQNAGFKAAFLFISSPFSVGSFAAIPGISLPLFTFLPIAEHYQSAFLAPEAPFINLRYGKNIGAIVMGGGTYNEDPTKIENYQLSQFFTLIDSDSDGTFDVDDQCPLNSIKVVPGACGCATADVDVNKNKVFDCLKGAEFKAQTENLRKLVAKLKAPSRSVSKTKYDQNLKAINTALNSIRSLAKNSSASISVASGSNLNKLLNSVVKQNTNLRKAKNTKSIQAAQKLFTAEIKKLQKKLL
jgi:hypothetical protein